MPYAIQIAVGRVVFPDGEELEHKGVTPDEFCVPTGEDLRKEHDPCLIKALALARKKAGLPDQVPDKLVQQVDELMAQIRSERHTKE